MINPELTGILILLIGAALDSIIGDPHSMPHPVRFFGYLIHKSDNTLNNGRSRRTKGIIMALSLIIFVWLFFHLVNKILISETILFIAFNSICFSFCISNRSLIKEGQKTESFLAKGDIEGAKKQLSTIVGRDTDNLNPGRIRMAILETISENLSDGVVAPLFYFTLGGIPLMMAYKMVNTLDSMVGYKNEKYSDFGWFSAKFDDLANYIPARLTALLIYLVTFKTSVLKFVLKYGRCHSSPNSGYPESAMAGVLDCRLGGPNYYGLKLVTKPYIGMNNRPLTHVDICKGTRINSLVFIISLAIITIIKLI